MREIVLDTETTGLDPLRGDRLVEIGCVEMLNRMPTGQTFHVYINPERDMPAEAFAVHGLSSEFLSTKPLFHEVVDEFLAFIGDAPLVIHNASFDVSFINAELDKASEDNERNSLVISTPNGRIGVVQIAGLIARRIVSVVREGQSIGAGERFGLIRFGSRLDVYLPEGTKALVFEGQTAVAGETILADFRLADAGRTYRAD